MAPAKTTEAPLVFKVKQNPWPLPETLDPTIESVWQVHVRTVKGLQKEAIVFGNVGNAWRMVSDEGVQLGGDETAPGPLEFFTAGMLFSLMWEILGHAKTHNVVLKSLNILQDNHYSISGSALKGDILGAARPAETLVKVEADTPANTITKLLHRARATSPAHALMRNTLANTFSLIYNGKKLSVAQVRQSLREPGPNPLDNFSSIQPSASTNFLPNLVTKAITDVETFCQNQQSLDDAQIEQGGTIYVHGQAEALEGALMEAVVQQCQPVISAFRFLCGEGLAGGKEITPPPLAYLLVGATTCYMTQLIRYAHITRQNFKSMSMVQNSAFALRGPAAGGVQVVSARPLDTQVFMETDESEEVAQETVSMAERMCFIQAAMRGQLQSILRVELNGELLPLPEEII